MFDPLDGPAKQGSLSVGVGAVVVAKVGANSYPDRKVITLQPTGKVYVYFADDNETPSTTDVSTKGFTQYKNAKESYEVGEKQIIYLLSVSGTILVKIAERA